MSTTKKIDYQEKFTHQFLSSTSQFHDYEYPKVSIVIPTENSSLTLSMTIDTLLIQNYPDYEIIIIDAGSTDRTIELLKSYKNDHIKIFSVSTNNKYEMLNKGITQSTGEYINFMFPGDYYLASHVLIKMMSLALENNHPQLLFCGTLLRYGRKEPEIFFRQLTKELLKKGQMPSSLQSCWFQKDIFHEIGKFDTSLSLRGGYELLCRLVQKNDLKIISTGKIFTDYDLRTLTRKRIVSHFKETGLTVLKYYGLWAYLVWFKNQKSLKRYLRLWWHGLKVALLGVKS